MARVKGVRGIRENSVMELKYAIELIEDHIRKDSNLEIAITLIKTTITHMEIYPEHCEFREGCVEDWEGKLPMSIREAMSS